MRVVVTGLFGQYAFGGVTWGIISNMPWDSARWGMMPGISRTRARGPTIRWSNNPPPTAPATRPTSGALVHCVAGAAVAGRGALAKGQMCFLMPWRKIRHHYYLGIEMPDSGVGVYTEGAEHVGKCEDLCAWTVFLFDYSRVLRHFSKFHAGAEGRPPCSFEPLELPPPKRKKLEGLVLQIAGAGSDVEKAAALTAPAVLKTLEDSILDIFASEAAVPTRTGFPLSKLRHRSLSRVVLQSWDLARQLPNENISVEDLCSATGASARQVQNAFLEITGLRPTAFLRSHRLQRARRMLLAGEAQSVKEAAYTCGFMDLGRFSAAFRNLFGELPGAALSRSGTL
jgi:AraC-like DNA-binding protein